MLSRIEVDQRDRARQLLREIASELDQLGLWESGPPAPEALESAVPFCFDVLEFHQWLQWVFIPRTHAVLDRDARLPAKSAIEPMAQWYCEENDIDGGRLVALVRQFDRLLS